MSMRCSSPTESSWKRPERSQMTSDFPTVANEQASVYISGKEDASKRRVFDHPGLRVMATSPAHVFAMEARAARTRDIDDLRLLAASSEWTQPARLCGYA